MTPKKDSAVANDTAWKWTPENDRKLFVLAFGRTGLGKEEWTKIATALSPNLTWNAVRQRLAKFRSEQKTAYDKLGWALPQGSAVKGNTASPVKRKCSEEGNEGEEVAVKSKKARAKKGGSVEAVKEEEEDADEWF
ncbi:hypothetical protein C7974DRAFT_414920 [Boeremia exigua]|uniref:uncharacterized protein n=1 Tax=Boeremia exigua TaxID=749465 RepID=UPI001E8EA754|nr:uncharacterized protein C7974DRAFT_414920 [Boeremia exigua]KAH6622260.1 hypothetical protein C7974DRAFT_414920 [Boeremia exigua]